MITLRAVGKRFGAARVLDAIDIDIPTGQRVALVGSNGAGKTTLFRCMLGEYTHDGEIRVDGRDPRHDRTQVLRHVGFVPQVAPPLAMPVGALLRFVAETSGAAQGDMAAVAARLGLDVAAIRNRPFVKLSGGMKQKVLIAAALGRTTRLLILDEPAANLDPAARAALFDLLAERSAASMIVSSHRLDEIAPLVNRVVELQQGRVVLDDTVSQAGGLGTRFSCRIVVARADEAFGRAAAEWGLTPDTGGTQWSGAVAGPDRLAFLGFAARHSGLICSLQIMEASHDAANSEPSRV
ncbi:MAG: ATP-binding cassette domain-containing protein [Rhizobiales bacterium]|nr:ATP-binding cassette domain-containing protein [Hyphomicrobiales bacterium]